MDLGFTHSFVSYKLASRLHLNCKNLTYELCVSMSLGDIMLPSYVYRNYLAHVRKAQLRVDLIVMPLKDFDMIL